MGYIIWQKRFDPVAADYSYPYVKQIYETRNNNYLLAGQILRRYSDYSSEYCPWFMILDSAGNIQFQKIYSGGIGLVSIRENESSGYIMAVTVNSNLNPYLIKLGSDGSVDAIYKYDISQYDRLRFNDLKVLEGGDYILLGNTTRIIESDYIYKVWLARIDASGLIKWQYHYDAYDGIGNSKGIDLYLTVDRFLFSTSDRIVIGGVTKPYIDEAYHLFLMKIDSNGDLPEGCGMHKPALTVKLPPDIQVNVEDANFSAVDTTAVVHGSNVALRWNAATRKTCNSFGSDIPSRNGSSD